MFLQDSYGLTLSIPFKDTHRDIRAKTKGICPLLHHGSRPTLASKIAENRPERDSVGTFGALRGKTPPNGDSGGSESYVPTLPAAEDRPRPLPSAPHPSHDPTRKSDQLTNETYAALSPEGKNWVISDRAPYQTSSTPRVSSTGPTVVRFVMSCIR